MLLLVLDSKTLLLMEVVDDADEVVLVDSKPPPRLDPEPPPPMGMGLESLRVPLMRDSSSSSKGLTPVKSEDDWVSDPPCRTLRGGATEVVEPPLGVSLDNSIGGGKPLEVAWKSDKLTIEDVCWDDDDDLGVVLLSREDEEEVGLLSELGMS